MDSQSSPNSGRPAIGLVSLICLVIGNMIGTGVYVSSGYSLADLKDAKVVLLVWVIAGVHAICGAVAYASVSRRLSVSGGEYAILSRWVHPSIGFLAAWISVIAGFAAPVALSGKLLGVYAVQSIDTTRITSIVSDRSTLELMVATFAILLAASLHAMRIGWNAKANNLVVSLKLLGLFVFIVWGAIHLVSSRESGVVATEGTKDSAQGLGWGIVASLYFTTLCYTGFNASIYLAGNYARPNGVAENDGRGQLSATDPIVGRSMIWACWIVTAIYLALNTIFLYSIPASQVVGAGEAFVGTVARQIGGRSLEQLMNGVILLSTATSVLAMTMTGPQVLLQLARDYRVGFAGEEESKVATRVALVVQTAITLLFVWSASIRGVATFLGLTLTVCGAVAIASLLIAVRARRSTLAPLTSMETFCSAVYVMGAAVLIAAGYWLVPMEFTASIVTFALGIALYVVAGLYRKRVRERRR